MHLHKKAVEQTMQKEDVDEIS